MQPQRIEPDQSPLRSISVLMLVGSPVDFFRADLSRVYAKGFLDVFHDLADYRIEIAYVSPDGSWRFPRSLDEVDTAAAQPVSLSDAVSYIEARQHDIMIPEMFCRPGMTTYRSLFDLLGIPHLGNRADVMAMTADKHLARAVVAAAGVAVPAGEVLRAGEKYTGNMPVVVKPADSDNSMGVSLVREEADMALAIDDALLYSESVIVETYVPLGREVRCGIIVREGELVCLPLEEYAVDEREHPIRARADKLERTADGELYLVAKESTKAWIVDVDDPVTEAVWAAARRCHIALGCRHYSLFDFRIDPAGVPWFLEAGLYCSYSPSSVISVMAAAAGIGVDELLEMGLQEIAREKAR
ncbi:D-alanine-D-alanine ligase [Williamsia limnetica]|uniref:D-alanine-D-alanine ligase n=1 Tax=Williamsia limnetica TaxID=882452 RepID=A0A318RIN6_WILLI|nr:D-alanine--D-alanine ligase [Williamsia limnetica]PYE17411.1 D-alanine-D-alanine ligase [Williamsia limnetica]